MMIDNGILEGLLGEAEKSPRLRANRDMRTSSGDRSQRMLNALLPGTEVFWIHMPKKYPAQIMTTINNKYRGSPHA